MRLAETITIEDLRKAAKRRLPRILFDFIEGGVEDEWGLRLNEAIFRQFRLMPRYFVDVTARAQTTELFGTTYASPFGICPTGVAGLWRPEADEMLAQAAAASNIPFVVSMVGTGKLETLAKLAPRHLWFQLYGTRDRSISDRLLTRVAGLGIETLVVTADVPVEPNRERNKRNGFARPLRLTPSIVLDGLLHPRWLAGYLKVGGRQPMLGTWAAYAPPGAGPEEVSAHYGSQSPTPNHSWDDVASYRDKWKGNLVLKGILSPEDALQAARLGIDGVIVSNHGGRQLDVAPSPIEVLPAISAAVGTKMTIMVDGGVRRGTDILIALCLGAQFVFVGRGPLYGVAAFGQPGAQRAIDILKQEIDINMGQVGCTDIAGLTRSRIARTGPDLIFDPPPAAATQPVGFGREGGLMRAR